MTEMTTQDQDLKAMQTFAKTLLVGLLGFATLFIVSGAIFTLILH
jgi:hypothetical protein